MVCRSWSTHPAHVESRHCHCSECLVLVCRSWSTHPAHVESIDTPSCGVSIDSTCAGCGAPHPAHVESIDTVTAWSVNCLGMSIVEHTSGTCRDQLTLPLQWGVLSWYVDRGAPHPAHVESRHCHCLECQLSWYVDRGAHIRHMSSQLTLSLLGVSCLGMSIVEHTSGTCRVN